VLCVDMHSFIKVVPPNVHSSNVLPLMLLLLLLPLVEAEAVDSLHTLQPSVPCIHNPVLISMLLLPPLLQQVEAEAVESLRKMQHATCDPWHALLQNHACLGFYPLCTACCRRLRQRLLIGCATCTTSFLF
jgi:hypothetical protein